MDVLESEEKLVEPGDTSGYNYSLALDIGTTTVVVQLINLAKGEIIGTVGDYNRQAAFGEDVISRIVYACEQDGLEDLHKVVVKNINDLIKELTTRTDFNQSEITSLLCSGWLIFCLSWSRVIFVETRIFQPQHFIPTSPQKK